MFHGGGVAAERMTPYELVNVAACELDAAGVHAGKHVGNGLRGFREGKELESQLCIGHYGRFWGL